VKARRRSKDGRVIFGPVEADDPHPAIFIDDRVRDAAE